MFLYPKKIVVHISMNLIFSMWISHMASVASKTKFSYHSGAPGLTLLVPYACV